MPSESIGEELQKEFFYLDIRSGICSYLQSSVLAFGSGKSLPCNLTGDCEYYYKVILNAYALHDQTLHPSSQSCPPPSHVQNDTMWNPRSWSMEQVNRNTFDQMSVAPYLLRYHCASPQIANPKTRGTGTYIPIPDMNRYYRSPQTNWRRRRSQSKPRCVTMNAARNGDRNEIISETNCGYPLLPEQSPQIPDMQVPLPSQVDHSDKPLASFQPQVPLYRNEDHNAVFQDSGSTVPVVSVPGQQVSSGANEVRNDQLQPDHEDVPATKDEVDTEKYKLKDDEEFPLLGTKKIPKRKWPVWRPKSAR